jgi:phospholipid/cholesterol/gamma-HCH transport system substrate-binding protein
MGRNLIETIMGAVVLVVAGLFLAFAYTHTDLKEVQGYEISAQFASVGGLDKGSDVRINGVKVGTVKDYELDKVTFSAVVKLSIASDVRLPSDTLATISTEGLLGGKFVKLIPGRDSGRIAEGGRIARTKDFKSIEEMVGELIFLATADSPAPAPAASTPNP